MSPKKKRTRGLPTLSQYYEEHKFNPVDCGPLTPDFLEQYGRLRKKIFEFNLRIPSRLFRDATVLEFGPASGENSMVLAQWGAKLHLVEPVQAFIDTLNRNFSKFRLSESIHNITCATFESFASANSFDFIIAEGFIHQVGEPGFWVPRITSYAGNDGFVIFSYPESAGFLIELLQAKCAQIFTGTDFSDILSAANALFKKKWDRVPHSRMFESWVMDNLASPLQCSRRLIDFIDLQDLMTKEGFFLWSSWPPISSNIDVTWVKKAFDMDDVSRKNRFSAMRMIPSLIVGTEIPTVEHMTAEDGKTLLYELRLELDALSMHPAKFTSMNIAEARRHHSLAGKVLENCVYKYDNSILAHLWSQIDECLLGIDKRECEKVIALFNEDGPLSHYWGSPNFYTVWHRF